MTCRGWRSLPGWWTPWPAGCWLPAARRGAVAGAGGGQVSGLGGFAGVAAGGGSGRRRAMRRRGCRTSRFRCCRWMTPFCGGWGIWAGYCWPRFPISWGGMRTGFPAWLWAMMPSRWFRLGCRRCWSSGWSFPFRWIRRPGWKPGCGGFARGFGAAVRWRPGGWRGKRRLSALWRAAARSVFPGRYGFRRLRRRLCSITCRRWSAGRRGSCWISVFPCPGFRRRPGCRGLSGMVPGVGRCCRPGCGGRRR